MYIEEVPWPSLMIAVVILCVCGCIGISAGSHSRGYEQGQIDAANGQQHYHLVTQPDGSTKWQRKDDDHDR